VAGAEAAYFAALERASRLAPRLPARERALAQVRWARATADTATATRVREGVRQHPDAAGLWYELGEFYLHDAEAMGSPLEAEQAFRHAAGLQPGVAPLRVHLVELAFRWHGDSTRIAREIAAYGELAPEGAYTSAARIAFALGFGNAAVRAGARADIPVLGETAAFQLHSYLTHPRFADERRAIVPLLETHLPQPALRYLRHQEAMTLSMVDGRAREALALLEEPGAPANARYCGPLYLSVRGLPVPRRVLEHRLALVRSDSVVSADPRQVMCAMGYAARLGAWGAYEGVLAGARQRAAGDGTSARLWAWAVRAGEGHGLQSRGRSREALRAFTDALSDGAGWALLWHVGQLALELGDLEVAERAFRALWSNRDGVPARLQLARILERTGRPSEARAAYQYATDAWRHADAELQPVVEEARRAVVRLSRAGN
jgi:tetratricopeptide (TPR) repeat protein